MKVYFKENNFCDNSRVGYDGCFVDYSFTPFNKSEACGEVIYYAVEISDNYTSTEVNNFCGKAIKNAYENKVTVLYALSELVNYTLIKD